MKIDHKIVPDSRNVLFVTYPEDAEKLPFDRAMKMRDEIKGNWGHYWRSATQVNETNTEACFLTCLSPFVTSEEWFRVPLLELEVSCPLGSGVNIGPQGELTCLSNHDTARI